MANTKKVLRKKSRKDLPSSNSSKYPRHNLEKALRIPQAIIEQNADGYRGQLGETYDFQMIVPEVGLDSWTSSTAYYFYVELS